MPILNVFLILGLVALVISFFIEERSAIWGGATLGLIIGAVIGIFNNDFSNILRAALIGADIGLLANLLSWIANKLKT